MEAPETKYVTVGDGQIAYQTVGDGPIDLLLCLAVSQIDVTWEFPPVASLLRRLGSFARLILFDRRGSGASDPLPQGSFSRWEEWAEDMTAVLDAAGSETAALFAQADAGPVAVLMAAMHPERVAALVLANTTARFLVDEDYPAGHSREAKDGILELMGATWGTSDFTAAAFPQRTGEPDFVPFISKWCRAAFTPRAAESHYRYIFDSLDVRDALGLVQAPTLVLHQRDNVFTPLAQGRYLADNIAGGRLLEISGSDVLLLFEDEDRWLSELAEFLTGERPKSEFERVLTTVLFTDISGSTDRAVSMGDHDWRSLLDRHDRVIREQLRAFRGQEIKTTGDGFVASFDGPARAIRCAHSINEAMTPLGIDLRFGLHTGECEVRGADLGGIAVHIAARVNALADPREILVSNTVKDLVIGSGIEFIDRGEHELKGVPEAWRLFAVGS